MSAQKEQSSNLQPRPPVVAVVGHVDHGKTTLLDYIRKTAVKAAPKGGAASKGEASLAPSGREPRPVAGREAGGITQSIGAYEIIHAPHESQTDAERTQTNAEISPRKSASSPRESAAKLITFIDTPGHKAFTLMRARGAAAADLAVLVVAADDGVMSQTKEAIEILKQTKTPFIVAITKIDSPNANLDKVKNELLTAEVLLEGYGGNVSWHGVSGKTGEGVSELLDLIILTGEVAGLTYDSTAPASGFVIESRKESRRGIVAHLILKTGVLKTGEIISTPTASGKIKILEDFLGNRVKELLPSAPALVVGFEKLPRAGEEFTTGEVVKPQIQIMPAPKVKPEVGTPGEEGTPRVRAILKADTSGSLEAMKAVLQDLVEIGELSLGEISDGDVNLAKSTGSIIVGFRVLPAKSALRLADSQRVKIITSDVIYKLVEAVTESAAQEEEKVRASLEVLAIFSVSASRKTVGGRVATGVVRVGNNIEIERSAAAPDGGEPRPEAGREVVGKGKIKNLQKDKEDVREVPQGNECGLVVETAVNIEVGDTLRVI